MAYIVVALFFFVGGWKELETQAASFLIVEEWYLLLK